jgi:hypothetical protein
LYTDEKKMAWMDKVYIFSSVVSYNMTRSCGYISLNVWGLWGFWWQWIIILRLFKKTMFVIYTIKSILMDWETLQHMCIVIISVLY